MELESCSAAEATVLTLVEPHGPQPRPCRSLPLEHSAARLINVDASPVGGRSLYGGKAGADLAIEGLAQSIHHSGTPRDSRCFGGPSPDDSS